MLKVRVVAAFALLILVAAVAVGCNGFFKDPVLTTMTIAPTTFSLVVNSTRQMAASGTFDDGSTKSLTGSAQWDSSDTTVATVSATGLVTAQPVATSGKTATITATSSTVSASATVTVNTGALTLIELTTQNLNPTHGTTITFQALGTFVGTATKQDITTQVTWTVLPADAITLNQGSGSGSIAQATTGGVTVSAALNNVTSNTLTLNVQ